MSIYPIVLILRPSHGHGSESSTPQSSLQRMHPIPAGSEFLAAQHMPALVDRPLTIYTRLAKLDLGWFQRGSVPTPAGRYRPGYRPAPVGKRGNRERGAVALPTGRAVGTDRRWSRARSVPTGRYRPGRSVPTPRPVGCHAALCDWPTAATSAPRQLAVAISRF